MKTVGEDNGGGIHKATMIGQVALNKSSLLLSNILQNAQTLQLLIIDIETESIWKSY